MPLPTEHIFEFDGYRVSSAQRRLLHRGEPVPLAPKAFDLLLLLLRHNGEVLEKDELMKRLWPDSFVEEANLNVHISALRKAFGESAQNPRYINTIPGRGYRFKAELGRAPGEEASEIILRERTTARVVLTEEVRDDSDLAENAVVVTRSHALQKNVRRMAHRPAILVACAVALFLGLAFVLYFRRAPEGNNPTGAGAPVRSLAVLPFKSLGGGDDEHLGVGVADTLITRLSRLKAVTVRPASAVLPYADAAHDPVEVGQELGVEAVLEGSIQREGERVRVTVRLIGVSDRRVLWGGQFDEQFKGILDVQDTISQKVAESLTPELSEGQRKSLVKRHTNDTEAYQSYLKGRHFWNKRSAEGLRRAVEFFHRAIEEDPQYALAYAGLADAYSMLGEHTGRSPKEYRQQAKAAAVKALELDDELAEAHASLAYLRMREWDWASVESEFKRALEINPNYATARQWYSIFLELTGRPEEAVAEAVRAQELDPLSPIINESLGTRLFFARKYERALEQLRKTIEIDQSFAQAHHTLGAAYVYQGKFEEAFTEFERARQLDDNLWLVASVGHAHAVSGRPDEARRMLDELKGQSKHARVPPEEVARIYAGLGEREQALAWLAKAYEEHSDALAFVKVDPAWDGLRSDPRFINILRRIGI
ncbi:MAG TPA: winged helix-turn-helix domain-containing protein [Pyrinomonadaceae bacterium]|nr:winged helix-turn-helix domain-containing protein [Pyrinomonadaceae bacterium]